MYYYVERYDPDTRQWLLKEFNNWFNNPKGSRAYVLLGDAAVGKSVMAAVIAHRAKNDGNLAAAYFCRHNLGTRRDPRYLLGSVAYQMCNLYSDYCEAIGGKTVIQNMLADSLLGVPELCTNLLEEPLSKCLFSQRKLVVIDALDESEYSSRDDFLDLIKNRFLRLPDWLLFFITSRPEDTVESRLKGYNPCVRICAGNSESKEFYQLHEKDIKLYLENRVNFLGRQYSSEDMKTKCNGMFLYAVYLVPILNDPKRRTDIDELPVNIRDFFRENFERMHKKLGKDLYKKLFSCVLMAPSPLPISFISFLLRTEGCALDEQEVIDAVSLFVQTTDQTFTFLHNLIPAWLTDEDKASRNLSIYKNEAETIFRLIVFNFLNDFLKDNGDKLSFVKTDSIDYILHFGFRFILESCSKTVFDCFTNHRFLEQRIRSSKVGLYFLIEDLEFSSRSLFLDENRKAILCELCSVLEHNRHVIAGCPKLLSSCLSNASKLTQETISCNQVPVSFMEPSMKLIDLPLKSILCDCCAISHDKKLLAGGQGRNIFMFDARTLQKVVGPIEVIDSEKLWHLEFSSDDKFVFFGRLDKWFSVQEKRVADIAQFAGNINYYMWGSFVYEDSYIAVIRNEADSDDRNTLAHIFLKWWLHEICRELDEELECIPSEDEIFRRIECFCLQHLLKHLEYDYWAISCMFMKLRQLTWRLLMCLNLPCNLCQRYGEIKTARDQIIHIFADKFKYQIWNVKTGRPVIEEMFCKQLQPFFYFWHIYPSIQTCDRPTFSSNAHEVSIANFAALITLNSCLPEFRRHVLPKIAGHPLELLDDFAHARSQDGKFVAIKFGHGIKLQRLNRNDDIVFPDLKYYCFTNDSNYFLYVTHKPNPNLYAFSLQTRDILQSISGLCPVVYASKEDKCFGYIFSCANERIMISLGGLSGDFFLGCLNCDTSKCGHPVGATFTSIDTITFLFSYGVLKSWKIGVDVLALYTKVLESYCSQNIHVKKCAFSHDGKLIILSHSCEILLFNCEGKFLSLVFKVTNEGALNVSFITFSSDDSLLIFCVQEHSNNQSFHVWHVNDKILSNPIHFPSNNPMDSCCFAPDNSKLFFCNAFGVFIQHYPPYNCPSLKISIPNKASLKCSHCAVSPDNKLLVFCIGNEILVHPLDGQNAFWKVPHNHSGLVESCNFLKVGRYLISYGIDGVVLLFDLAEWKSVAYARLQESIRAIAVSPDEDKVVCLRSSGEGGLINLHGLTCGLPSNFQLPTDFRLPDTNRERPVRRGISQPSEIVL